MDLLLTRIKFVGFNPFIPDIKLSRLVTKYKQSNEYRTIRREEQRFITEKWNLLREFFQPEEIATCIDRANYKFITEWYIEKRHKHYINNIEKVKQQSKEYYQRNKSKLSERVPSTNGRIWLNDYQTKSDADVPMGQSRVGPSRPSDHYQGL